ncbi:MAG: HAD family phosphatase [Candidatus Micrarchaeota archaeon]|nr:HAD family phosphatase [Candidatus Micrarchaeota archaeon]
MIKCILFDLGGVLVDFSDDDYLEYLSKVSGKSRRETVKKVEFWWRRLDLGIIHVKFFKAKISKIFGIGEEEVQWVEFYEKKVRLDRGMIALAKKLRKNYRIAFLSNIDLSRYDIALRILDLKWFDYDFASCYIKRRKPDPEVYRYVLRKMRLRPREVIFIDNRLDNVLGARSVGIRSIVFKNRTELQSRLKKLGVIW